jgi:hypothetical protein
MINNGRNIFVLLIASRQLQHLRDEQRQVWFAQLTSSAPLPTAEGNKGNKGKQRDRLTVVLAHLALLAIT